MQTLVVYDSKFGNTKTIAETIAAALSEGFPGEVTLLHASDATVPRPGEVDLLVVGAPTHGGRPSPAAKEFLDKIKAPALKGVKVAGFDTRATHWITKLFGYAAPRISKVLKKAGGTPAGAPGDFCVAGTEGPLLDGELDRAAAWARGLLSD